VHNGLVGEATESAAEIGVLFHLPDLQPPTQLLHDVTAVVHHHRRLQPRPAGLYHP